MPANELSGRFYYQRCSDQPSGCRKLEQKGVDKTGFIISAMNCEALLGVSSAHQHRRNRTAITIDHCIPEPELNLSERCMAHLHWDCPRNFLSVRCLTQ